MPVVKVYQHGMSCGVAPKKNDHDRAKRNKVKGWSDAATRRNMQFLQSVDVASLTGHGIAFTCTQRDCPPTAKQWHAEIRAFVMRLSRMGMIRLHWVTEWQRRGVPHLHGVAWFDSEIPESKIVAAWLAVSSPYTSSPKSQFMAAVSNAVGWFQYMSKHAARGVKHYQRSAENVPVEWKTETGRVWGKCGDWVTHLPKKLHLETSGFWALRRMCRGWRVADARAARDRRRIRSARRMLKCGVDKPHPDRQYNGPTFNRSKVRGATDWIPQHVTLAMLYGLAASGHFLCDKETGEYFGES